MDTDRLSPPSDAAPGRIAYLDALRPLAALAVVLLHTADGFVRELSVGEGPWNIGVIYDGLTRWAVPVFVMISGALFLDPDRPVELRSHIRGRVGRLAGIYCFWSAVYAVISTYVLKKDGSPRLLLARFVSGHYHLWFLMMLAGLYLLVPLLRKLTERREDALYFLVLSGIFTFLLPALSAAADIIGTYWLRDSLTASAGVVLTRKIRFYFTLGLTPYFVGGYILHTAEITPCRERIIYLLGILGAVVTVGAMMWDSRLSGTVQDRFFEDNSIPVMLQSAAVFVFARKHLNTGGHRLLRGASRLCLGVYLLHALFLDAFTALLGTKVFPVPWASIPAAALGVFLLSLGAAWCLKKIPGLRRLL